MHGTNGLNPKTSFRIYKIYVLPRFLYGLASNILQPKQIDTLEREHRGVLRKIQGLPRYTATCAIYLLLGALPFEGLYHLSQLSLLNSILHSGNMKVINLCQRQLAVKDYNSRSWFVTISKILQMYNLPTINYLLTTTNSKVQLKMMFKQKVTQYWSSKLLQDAQDKSTLQYLALPPLNTNDCHPLWSTAANNIHDVKRAFIKAKLATGTMLLQDRQYKFGLSDTPTCQLCRTEKEDVLHFLKTCPALYFARERNLNRIKATVVQNASIETWQSIANDDNCLIQLLIDCTKLDILVGTQCDNSVIERFSRLYCASLFETRARMLDEVTQKKKKNQKNQTKQKHK